MLSADLVTFWEESIFPSKTVSKNTFLICKEVVFQSGEKRGEAEPNHPAKKGSDQYTSVLKYTHVSKNSWVLSTKMKHIWEALPLLSSQWY